MSEAESQPTSSTSAGDGPGSLPAPDTSAAAVVSVVIPAYNAAGTLAATLASVLDQSHEALEILVIDDGSTDDTAAVIARAAAADPRIRPVGDGTNHGRSFSRNLGISLATGEWVAMVDADDLLHRDRFRDMLRAARGRPGCRLVTDDRWGFTLDERGVATMQHRFPARHTLFVGRDRPLDPDRHFTDRFGHLDLLVQRAALLATGATYPEDLAIGEDLAFYLELLYARPSLLPVRRAAGSYYYRLAPTSRDDGSADVLQQVVDRVVEHTGATELRRLADRWQPVHSFLMRRADETLRAEGRLRGRAVDPDPRVQPDPRRGMAWLVSVKALQWAGRLIDRRQVAAVTADVNLQLRRDVDRIGSA
jgi:hypothetical protein